MFAVIDIKEPRNTFRKGGITSERINLPSGDVFFVVSVEKSFGKVPWKKLERCLGILRQCVILPEGVQVPAGVNITPFEPDVLARLLLINSAADYITGHKKEFICRRLTVFDETGIYADYIEGLINCFGKIKIVTARKENYERLSRRLMETYGFSLLVTERDYTPGDVVISYRCNVPVYFTGTVFTAEKKNLMSKSCFCGKDITLPEEYESLRPPGVGRVLFACALYEKCGENLLGKLKYDSFGC